MTRADYLRHRDRMIAYGRWQPFVPAGRAREHLRALSAQGVGWAQAAALAGLPPSTVSKLLYGNGRAPSKRIRPETEAAILAVNPTLDIIGAQTAIDATGTQRRLQALACRGWSMARLDAALSGPGRQLDTILRRDTRRVRAVTARTVRDLYDELWDQDPPEGTPRERAAAAHARNRAKQARWAPVGAWDDEAGPHCIDDPAASPAPGWDGHAGARPPADLPPVAAVIREARKQAALSRPRLAAVVGVSASAVQWWEEGNGIPNEEHWVQLDLALGPLGIVRDPGPGREAATERSDAA